MGLDDDDLIDFLDGYADACAKAVVEPLPITALAALVDALLTGTALRAATLR